MRMEYGVRTRKYDGDEDEEDEVMRRGPRTRMRLDSWLTIRAAALPVIAATLIALVGLAGCGEGTSSTSQAASASHNSTTTTGASTSTSGASSATGGSPGKSGTRSAGAGKTASGGGGVAVATVNGTAIAKSTFEHWLAVTAALVANEKANDKSSSSNSSSSASSQEVRNKALGFLITQQWVLGEAAAKGVSVSAADVQKRLTEIEKEQFKKSGELQKYLAKAHESEADLQARIRLELLERAVAARVTSGKHTAAERQAALTSLQDAFQKKWKALTSCRAGYVMEDCGN
jgi:hypothetical protein